MFVWGVLQKGAFNITRRVEEGGLEVATGAWEAGCLEIVLYFDGGARRLSGFVVFLLRLFDLLLECYES